ncbi:MAG: winged helix-turn-helix transcriptional regulator [Acidobacteria bacterium]|nr:winged helix-turn-helix transcriptional regulator [Acidobacteriota bacterium]MBK7934373.1 winged helix-turn-helix transcriptional regulator [Acidobacteriota bacterium]
MAMAIMAAEIDFEQTVSYLLAKVTTAFRNSLERQMGQIGLHSGQIFILLELWDRDGQRQIDLANRLNLSAPTVNKTVNGLIEINLVSRERLEDDGRSTRIFLTESGSAIRSQIESQWIELEESCLVGLSETERLILFELLGKLRNTYTGREAVTGNE